MFLHPANVLWGRDFFSRRPLVFWAWIHSWGGRTTDPSKAGSKQTDHSGSSLEVTVMPCGNAPCSSPARKCRFSSSCNRNFPLPVSLWNLVNSCFSPVPVFGPMCHMLLDVLSVFRVSPQASYDQGNAFILDALLLRSTYLCILTYNCDKVNN